MNKLLLVFAILAFHLNTNAQKFRVIARTTNYYDTSIQNFSTSARDSTNYYYSTNNFKGSSKMGDTINYDTARVYIKTNGTLAPYAGFQHKTYNAANKVTLRASYNDTGKQNEDQYTYYAKGQIKQFKHLQSTAINKYPPFRYNYLTTFSHYYEYDTNGNTTLYVHYTPGYLNPNPHPYDTTYYYYNTNKQLLKDSLVYGYIPIVNTYQYNSNGHLTNKEQYESFGGTRHIVTRNSYTYNSNGLMAIDSLTHATAGLQKVSKYSYDNAGDRTIDSVFTYNNRSRVVKITITNRSYIHDKQIHKLSVVEYDSNFRAKPEIFTKQTTFYYAHYWPNSIIQTKTADTDFTLYPNPTTKNTNISIELRSPETINATITDITGKTVLQTQPTLYSKGKKIIRLNTERLPTATYIVNLKDRHGLLLWSSKLIKQ